MPKNKKLEKKITYKLEKLQEIVDNISETQNIDPDDPDTWDSDTLYNLVENCKEVIKLLEDKVIPGKYDALGLLLNEDGLCSLVDTYQSEEEETKENF